MKHEKWTSEQFQEYLKNPRKKPNKFGAKKTLAGGRIYDSRKEAEYAGELNVLLQAGKIAAYIPPVSIPVTRNSKRRYLADFLILKPGWEEYIEIVDVKGHDTPQSKLKRDLLFENYGIDVKLV
jgi:hypothetical protein